MAQIGVKCIRGLVKHDDCRKCSADPCHPCELPPDILEGIREDPEHRHSDPDIFSPTYLLDCDRKAGLTYEKDWYIDIYDAWPMLRGTLVHSLMQSNRYPGAVGILRETEMMVEIETAYGPQKMAGQPDLVVVNRIEDTADGPIAYVKIVDYKSTSEIKHELTSAKPDHVRQVNMYAWLVRRWLPTHHRDPRMQVVVEELEIVYLDFKKVRRFTSAGPLVTRGKMKTRSPKTYETNQLSAIKLHDDVLVDRNIRRLIEAKIESRETLPPAYEPGDEEYWRCAYCPVADACREMTARGI